jgi:paraquat-inducible protein A
MRSLLISLALLSAGVAFGLGITLPLVRLEKFYFFSETPSLVEMITALWNEGDIWIAGLVSAFSIIFPLLKMAIVFNTAISNSTREFPRWISYLSKWSMMDVLLVALVIFGAKTSGIATAIAQPGIWFYAAAALLSVLAAEVLKHR